MMWRLRRSRDPGRLDARAAEAVQAAEHAEAEAELSQRRLESIRQHVVEPLRDAAERNQFSEMIRATLTNGGDTHEN